MVVPTEKHGVSVCIPTHVGRGEMTSELLRSVSVARACAGVPVEAIVVDDPEGPGQAELAGQCRQRGFSYLRGPRSAGEKRNMAAQRAKFDTLLFVDSDCLLAESTIREHQGALNDAPPSTAGIVGRTVMFGAIHPIWHALRHSRLNNTCFDFSLLYGKVGWGVTCNLSVRRRVFLEAGGFCADAFTLVGGEDVDLGVRITERGYQWLTNPHAVVLHRRDSITRLRQATVKQFTYGQADAFLTWRHPARRSIFPNPFPLGALLAVLALAVTSGDFAVALGVGVLPAILVATQHMTGAGRRRTIYGKQVRRDRLGPRRWSQDLLDRAKAAFIDMAFDLGIAWEAIRRGRPASAFCRFVYADPREFIERADSLPDSLACATQAVAPHAE